jgi:hypothetical protein
MTPLQYYLKVYKPKELDVVDRKCIAFAELYFRNQTCELFNAIEDELDKQIQDIDDTLNLDLILEDGNVHEHIERFVKRHFTEKKIEEIQTQIKRDTWANMTDEEKDEYRKDNKNKWQEL